MFPEDWASTLVFKSLGRIFSRNLRILSARGVFYNIRMLPTVKNFKLKHGSIRGFFDEHNADIICFQETKLVEDKITRELACVDGYESFWVFSEKKLGYSGVATYARDSWAPTAVELDRLGTIDTDLNGEGRVIVSDHGSFVLLNVYVPNAGAKQENMTSRGDLKIRFLHALKDKCDALRSEGREVMIVGDLNIAASQKDMHPTIRFEGLYHPQEVAVLQSILKTYIDVWRLQHPNESESYTCWDEKSFARSVNKGVRIDYVLVSPGLLARMGKCEIISTPSKWSDHAALLVTVKDIIPPEPHNPVPQSSKRMKRFDTRSQPTIASMFARRSSKVTTAAAKSAAPGTASALQPNADNAVDQTVKTGVEAAVKEAALGAPIVDSAPSSLEEENQNARKRQRTTSDPG